MFTDDEIAMSYAVAISQRYGCGLADVSASDTPTRHAGGFGIVQHPDSQSVVFHDPQKEYDRTATATAFLKCFESSDRRRAG